MKEFSLLIWLTQLGLSSALPLAGFVLLGVWLHRSIGWGQWTIWTGFALGLISALHGFRGAMKAMERMGKNESEPPPNSFNEHS